MNTLKTLPGFTAEASIYHFTSRYHGTVAVKVEGGVVQPASSFSDYATLEGSFASIGPVFTPRPLPCIKWQCIHPPNRNPICFRTLGFWNSTTHRCE